MAHNKTDMYEVGKKAKEEGYRTATSFPGWVKDDGRKVKFNGGSVNINGTTYTSVSDTKKSGSW